MLGISMYKKNRWTCSGIPKMDAHVLQCYSLVCPVVEGNKGAMRKLIQKNWPQKKT
jgi:hypothetical protein